MVVWFNREQRKSLVFVPYKHVITVSIQLHLRRRGFGFGLLFYANVNSLGCSIMTVRQMFLKGASTCIYYAYIKP